MGVEGPADDALRGAAGAAAPPEPASRSGDRPRRIEPEHLYKGIGLFFLYLVLYSHFEAVSRVLLMVYAAAVMAVALNILVGLFPTHRKVVSAFLGMAILAAIGVALWFAVPALGAQLRGLTAELPRFERELDTWTARLSEWTGLNISLFGERTRSFLGEGFGNAEILGRAMGIVEAIFLPLVILFGGIFAVASPNDRLLTAVLHVVPSERRGSFRRLFSLLGIRLRGWVKGVLISMLVVGVFTTVGLWLLGVRFAFLLGVVAGLFEIVPLVGPFASGFIAVGVALLDEPSKAIWVASLMIAVQQVESYLITPIVMSKAAEVHPFVTLFSLFLFGSVFGFLGLLLALPLVLVVWTVIEVLWIERAMQAAGEEIVPLVRE